MVKVAKWLCFDCETIATQDSVLREEVERCALRRRPAHGERKESRIMWDSAEKREERAREALDKTAVDVMLAEPIVVCWETDDGSVGSWSLGQRREELTDGYYAGVLEELRDALEAVAGVETVWVGHNICCFDLAVLLNTWRRWCIRPPDHFPVPMGSYWRGKVYDTMVRAPGKTPFVSLDALCKRYRVRGGKCVDWRGAVMTGARVSEAYAAGEWELLERYCRADVDALVGLYEVMTAGGTWGTWGLREVLVAQVAEIEESGLSESQQALAIVKLLDGAGLIPRR